MISIPTPPEAATIERVESATREHAITGIAPLGYDSRKNGVQLKNLARDVVGLVEEFAGKQAAAAIHRQLDELAAQTQPLQRPASICMLTDGASLESLLLPEPFPNCVIHDNRYYVRPMIQAAATHGEFLLLALAQGDVHLYRMNGEHMTAVELEGLPDSLTDVVGEEVEGRTLQHHSAGGTRFHGQGKGNDDRDTELEQFLRAVDGALTHNARTRAHYLMVAAVDEVAAAFRHVSRHEHLLDETITLSPDQTADEGLRTAAAEAFERWRRRDNHSFIESLKERRELRSTEDVVRAAAEGRVDTLLATRDQWLWGRFDDQDWSVNLHGDRRPGSQDLVDTAMRAAWRQGGQVRIVDDARELGAPLAAQLRY